MAHSTEAAGSAKGIEATDEEKRAGACTRNTKGWATTSAAITVVNARLKRKIGSVIKTMCSPCPLRCHFWRWFQRSRFRIPSPIACLRPPTPPGCCCCYHTSAPEKKSDMRRIGESALSLLKLSTMPPHPKEAHNLNLHACCKEVNMQQREEKKRRPQAECFSAFLPVALPCRTCSQ